MIEKEVEIQNKLGMHLRAAAIFIETANKFKAEVYLKKDDTNVNAKSIMGLMTLGAAFGSKVTIITDGEDELESQEALVALVENKFGEKE